ncbi:MAG: hypothetical protein PHG06_15480 [Parabacteroides sp.]|nr:hypothetical protein [Parabacteroides sp.]
MFKEFDTNPQFDMFSSPAGMSRGSSLNIYLKDDLWHNIFREHIVARVNEDIFKVLYSSDKGSPNVPACVLVGMMILKEGQGWSDEQLFEQCRYKRGLSEAEFALIDHIMNEPGSKFIHRGNKREVDARFVALGKLMSRFIKLFKKHDYDQHQTLRTVFEQQFTVTLGRKVLPLEKEKVSARSIQSSHDTDANYRDKVGNKVKGYLVNPTETCDDPESDDPGEQVLNLITDINLDVVFTPDSEFIEPSLEESRGILEEKIEKVYADGAYNSTGNQAFARGNDMGLILSDIHKESHSGTSSRWMKRAPMN